MGQVPRYLFLFLLFSTFIVEQAQSYVPTLTPKGTPIRWKGPVKLRIAGNSSNSSYFAPGPFFDSVVAGLNRWKAASDNRVEFDYWQGTDAKKYPTTNEFDGLSTISFASNSKHPPQLSTHILGVTQVWYQPDTGEIWDVDITLNDRDFIFTNDPKNTSGYGGGELLNHGGKNQVYIENVITHELGHALGLSHSGGLQSTMLFMESPEQAYLGCDDKIGIQALYGAPNTRGSLTGFVKNELGAAVFGAHIVAISQNRGVVLATALTDSSGRYTLQALEPGPYFLAAEPFYAGPTALPPYYSEINTNFCRNKTPFGRSFLTEADGNQLQTFEVESGKTTQATELTVHCNDSTENLGGAFVVTSSVPELRGVTAIPLFEAGGRQKGTFGILDRMGSSTEGPSYLLSGISGHLEVHAMAYSLYSPVHISVSLLSANGEKIRTQIFDPIYKGDSGYVNFDSALTVDQLPLGNYLLQIQTRRLDAQNYPAGAIALDRVPFFILEGIWNSEPPPLDSSLPRNARCRTDDSFPLYQSPPGDPPRTQIPTSSSGGVGFCGTVDQEQDSEIIRTSIRPDFMTIFSWFIPWIMMLIIAKGMALAQRRPTS